MSPLLIGGIGIAALLIFLGMGVPIAFSMLIVGIGGLVMGMGDVSAALSLVQLTPYYSTANWLYTVVPMFILMGLFASEAGIIKDLFTMFSAWIGRWPGSLALVTIASSAGFAFATGSSIAATAIIGKTMLPEMASRGYDRKLYLGTSVAGGTLGNLIPPSIGLTLFGIITETSIGRLLIGGIVPGIIVTLFFMAVVVISALRNPAIAPPTPPVPWRTRIFSLKNVWGMLLLVIFVLGSIYAGIGTVTEAAAVGAFGAFAIALAMRRLTWRKFVSAMVETGLTTGVIFLLIAAVSVFSRFLNFTGVTKALTVLAVGSGLSPIIVLLGVYFVYLFFGCLMDPTSLMLLVTPIVFPMLIALGFNAVWFGVVTVVLIQIGFLTPPVGLAVYVLKGVTNATLEEIFSAMWPYLWCWIIALALFTIWPQILLWLPSLMMR